MIKRKKGQSIVEFALVLPVLLLILMGIIEFGLMFNAHVTMVNAAREGARYGAIPSRAEDDIKTRTINAAIGLNLTPDEVAVAKDIAIGSNKITITITHDYTIFTPIMAAIVGNSFPMKASAVMSLE